ncbi:hypothetical protein KC19_5G148200 [Ceratodon purpureus]|uniref:Uncharacterized protein n=1 Tax=Ceratodon purpureus TaxID=3225 RepID=A0A8T0I2I1_CERPU|nr:hypothetical protein KC19_5G148200 [Ceratodon purpureus]
MKRNWEEWTRKWLLCKTNISLKSNHFVPIPQEHKDDEHTQQGNNGVPTDKDSQSSSDSQSLFEKFMSHARSTSLPRQVLRTCPISDTDVKHSKANLLNTKQLFALTFFALTGGSFGVQECLKLGGPMLMFITFFLIHPLWTIPIILMTIEMTCMIPESGGHVLWVYRAFGPFWSYMNGAFAFACSVLDNAMFPSLFLEYLSILLPRTSNNLPPLNYAWGVFIKMIILMFVTIVNVIGIDIVGNASFILMVFIVVSLVIIPCFGIKYIDFSWMASPISEKTNRGKFLAILLWNTSGMDIVGTCASEVLTPSYSYPRAVMYGFLLLVVSNALPFIIGTSIFSNQEDWNDGTYFDVAKIVGGNPFEVWMGVVGLCSVMGLLLVRFCTNSRILYGMAQVDQMPAALTILCPKFHTPIVAILVTSMCTIVFNFFNVYHLVEADMLFYALSTLLKFGALIQLRYTEPDVLRPFQIPLEKHLLMVFMCCPMIMCILILIYASERSQGIALIGGAIGVFSYICKECFTQYGIKEVAEKRLVRVQENLERMQKRIDVVIEKVKMTSFP